MKKPYIVVTNETLNNYDNYKQLGVSIVSKAIDDYKKAVKILHKEDASKELKNHATGMIADVKRFLDSEWLKMLVDIDARVIKQHLKTWEAKYEKKNK